ncbi:hypothetical protein GCM10025771_31430 [Niveibacterium umoris]|uniref:Immunity MXAN-0049 protein domain-containing protein n=1 Tax=Niveibacterium umoris TaxID=1193620 RepID=A0A840BDQ7_9RHOO|nr:DUF1629 domain-containing protein [Niveibacterium umoris]MBB4011661.1 hypothetical protein [Niveibacterium umoris]
MSNYLIWKYESYPGSCVLKDMTGLDMTYRLNDGTPLAFGFPSNVSIHMNPDYPDDLVLGDSLRNSDMLIIASARLKDILAARQIPKLEFLPVSIIDHKGSIASSDYAVIHPVDPVDCLDREKSIYETGFLDPDAIGDISKLVLDEALIPPDRQIFRLAGYWDLNFARRDLAEALTAAGLTGIRFIELSAHPET